MKDVTMQTYFYKTLKHLRDQGRPTGTDIVAGIALRTEEGLSCSIGFWMGDDPVPENNTQMSKLRDIYSPKGHAGTELALSMQRLHDTSCNWSDKGFVAEEKAEHIAKVFGLKYTPPRKKKRKK